MNTDERIVEKRATLIKQIMDMSNPCNVKLLSTLLQFSDEALEQLRDELIERSKDEGKNIQGWE